MLKINILSISLLFVCLLAKTSFAEEVIPSAYLLGYGDKVIITVYGENDLTVETQLNDVGVITFPFLGDIEIFGLTIPQVQQKIESGLKEGYLVDPKVSVSIKEYRRFYVNGEVKQPGGFAFLPGLTVRKAISLAGGFSSRAAKNKIYIVSDTVSEDKPKQVDLNTAIKPGDVVTVKQRFF